MSDIQLEIVENPAILEATSSVTVLERSDTALSVVWATVTSQGVGVDAGEYASLNAAVAAIGTIVTRLFVDTSVVMTAACVIPANISLDVSFTGRIDTQGYALSFVNRLFQGGLHPVFLGSGAVSGLGISRPEWFGAVTDGSTDSTVAIQRAANAGTALTFSTGTYRVTSSITIPATVHEIIGAGKSSTTISAAGGTISGAILNWSGGGFAPIAGLVSDPVAGDTTLTFASDVSSVLAAGDVISIFDPTASSYSAARSYYYAGEFAEVVSVSTATVTTKTPLYSAYNKTVVQITKMNSPVSGSMRGITVLGTGDNSDGYVNVKISGARNVLIDDCLFDDANYTGIAVAQSYGVKIVKSILNCNAITNTGLQYGLMVTNSQNLIVSNCKGHSMRHVVAIGGGSTTGVTDPRITNRNIEVIGNDFSSTEISPLDAHGNTEHYLYSNNIVTGFSGIDFCGNHGVITNNLIRVKGGYGISGGELKGATFVVSNNTIESYMYANTAPLYIYFEPCFVTTGVTTVSGNKINSLFASGYSGVTAGITVQKNAVNKIGLNLEVIGNTICLQDTGRYAIYINGQTGNSGMEVTCNYNTVKNGDVFIDYVATSQIVGNTVKVGGGAASRPGIKIISRYGAPSIRVTDNEVRGAGNEGIRAQVLSPASGGDATVANNVVSGNNLITAGPEIYGTGNSGVKWSWYGNTVFSLGSNSTNYEQLYNGTATRLESQSIETIDSAAALDLYRYPGSYFNVSGTTNITSIISSAFVRPVGYTVTLRFADVLTVTDGSNLKLNGNFTTTLGSMLTLKFDGTNWVEVSRGAY